MHILSRKEEMELIIIITLLSIFFSALQPTTCSSLQIQPQASLHHEGTYQQLSLPMLPRKLRFTEKVKESDDEARDVVSHKQKDSLPAGKQLQKKQNVVLGKRGTRQEWVDDPSQYFTMDYTRVKRRRPIHNKQLPVGP